MDEAARRQRAPDGASTSRQRPPFMGSPLFPRGHESPLRALGVELDALKGVSLVSIIATRSTLYLDYDRIGADLPDGMAHQHLALSAEDLEAMRAAAGARRRATPGGRTLRGMIQRARET
jgi:hypothetical protein